LGEVDHERRGRKLQRREKHVNVLVVNMRKRQKTMVQNPSEGSTSVSVFIGDFSEESFSSPLPFN